MNGIAIDLGSVHSMAARLNDQGVPTLIPDVHESDQFATPSLIQLGGLGPLVGRAAVVAMSSQPESQTIEDAKSMLASGRVLGVDSANKGWSAEECVALVLSKLRQDASSACFQAVEEVLLTVPSRFTSAQRNGLCQAAKAAGLRVRALVDECLAAAVYAASQSAADQTILVLQSGRSGFDAAIVRCSGTAAVLLASRHDNSFGGKAIDQRLADEICAAQGWRRDALSPIATRQLLHFAQQLKIALCQTQTPQSQMGSALADLPRVSSSSPGQVQMHGTVGKSTVEFVLTHWHFREMMEPMLERAFELIERCLDEAGLDWAKIDRVMLAGGTTQLPEFTSKLTQSAGLSTERIASKDCLTAVAYGAAILAARSDEQLARYDITRLAGDVAGERAALRADEGPISMFDIGIRIGDPRSGQAAVYKLIKRGAALPAKASKQFRTSRAGQPRLIIEAVKTTGSIRRAESLGHFSLALPAGLPANHPIIVTMYCDASGQIRVDAEASPVSEMHRS